MHGWGLCRLEEDAPRVCEPGGEVGYFVPMFGEAEQRWPMGLRALLYFAGLCWIFVGVAILADAFMAAIEKITSATKIIKRVDGRKRVVLV